MFFKDDLVVIFDYIQVIKAVQCINFRYELLLFPLLHPSVVKLFPAENLIISLSLDFEDIAEAACNKVQNQVEIHVSNRKYQDYLPLPI